MKRVILDTNVLLSGPLTREGNSARLIAAWRLGLFTTLVACDELLAEFRDVAERPSLRERLRADTVDLLWAFLRDISLF